MGAAHQTRDAHNHDHHGHGHSHGLGGHHHHHDTTYLTSRNRSDPGVRITNIGLVSNLLMAVAKFVGGWAFNSKSMVADGWHSLTDLASDVLTLATVSWSIKPPTDRFPLGFGKVESLGALGVSSMLLVGGCYMGWESALALYAHFNPEAAHSLAEHIGHGHSHSHSPAALGLPSIHAAWIAAGTIVVKEWLYHATMKVAKEKHSSVLASNAVHHRVDSLTGIVTLVAIVGANLFHNAGWLDPVGGLLISFMVIHAGAGNTLDAFCELADQSIDQDVKKSVRKQASRAIEAYDLEKQTELRDVAGVKSGQNYLVDLEMAVPGSWSVEHVREVEAAIRDRVGRKVKGVKRVRVRFVSMSETPDNKFDEFINERDERLEPEEDPDSETEASKGRDHKH
ncbi:cation efflux family-domain-containing protein [Emericellopsis atlantica]|uniref:Cation efflux family-domain-containing protein n=1 Tax=Emericellopsis atlantica TaxID=2614577 RepID=A0A9P8CLE8_9HYPO|nr:cation efflux family-domain-containing protein [Emericellopsis atlantica]KAG9251549.1 cation efflux family-domain-containing protein [Emericellopsis atlantica]